MMECSQQVEAMISFALAVGLISFIFVVSFATGYVAMKLKTKEVKNGTN